MELLDKPKFRGERNNNPFNLDRNPKNNWLGKCQSTDSRQECFIDPVYGLRAGFKVLRKYVEVYGINTVDKIFDRYAPPEENDTEAYKRFVCDKVGIGLHDKITNLRAISFELGKTIVHMEQGRVIYPDEMFEQAIQMAFA